MKYAIELELEQIEDATGIRFDLEDIADDFWSELVRITRQYVKGRGAAKRVISYYFVECSSDYYCSDNTITLIFPDSGGLCTLSSLLSLHWAELVLSTNEERFRNFFKQMKWNLKTKFDQVDEIRRQAKHYYFESKQRIYAISKSREGEPYLVYDEGDELELEELTAATQKKYLGFLEKQACQCPICRQIEAGTIKEESVKLASYDLFSKERYSFNSTTLKCYSIVEVLNLDGKKPDSLKGISKMFKLKSLALSYNELESIDEELCQLPALEELDLYENSIVELPPNIGQLTNLKLLRSGRSEKAERGLTALPDSFSNLKKLEELTLSSQHFTQVPPQIFKLDNLISLDLCENRIEIFPEEICALSKLKELDLSDNRIKELPRSLGSMRELTVLEIGYNPIRKLDDNICTLTNLTTLGIYDTEIEELPDDIGNLTKLDELILPDSIKKLPASIKKIPETRLTTSEEGLDNLKRLAEELSLPNPVFAR